MATSGTTTFNLEIAEIIDDALERAGGETISGYEAISARRSLNLLLLEWVTRGINLWTMEEGTQTMTQGTTSYTLASDTVDIMNVVLRRDSLDTHMERIPKGEYQQIANKTLQGRPVQYFLDRQRDAPVLHVYLAPENSTDVVRFWRIRQIQDVTKSAAQNADVPKRFLPALISGLAYYMLMKRTGKTLEEEQAITLRRNEMKQLYEQQLALAMEEDEDNVSVYIRPGRRHR